MGNYVPGGSYSKTCKNIKVTLTCEAQKIDQTWVDASLDITSLSNADIANINGTLENQGTVATTNYVPGGSYSKTCKNIKVTLDCEAKKIDQTWVDASLDITSLSNADIANINGTLENQARKGISAVFTEIYDGDSGKANTSSTPYDKFDILYVAFAHIDKTTYQLDFEDVKDGGKNAEKQRLANILNLVQPLRTANKIKVVISLGWGEQFNDIPLIEANLSTFAPSVKKFIDDNKLDGFDIDYEVPTFSSLSSFQKVASAIREALGKTYLFTITPNNTTNLDGNTLNTYFDYVNIQSYDCSGDAHCSITEFIKNMTGLSRSKILAGADTDNGENIKNAVEKYDDNGIGGIFAWKLSSNFKQTANIMWNATR
jgi:GH18 family chitinase